MFLLRTSGHLHERTHAPTHPPTQDGSGMLDFGEFRNRLKRGVKPPAPFELNPAQLTLRRAPVHRPVVVAWPPGTSMSVRSTVCEGSRMKCAHIAKYRSPGISFPVYM